MNVLIVTYCHTFTFTCRSFIFFFEGKQTSSLLDFGDISSRRACTSAYIYIIIDQTKEREL